MKKVLSRAENPSAQLGRITTIYVFAFPFNLHSLSVYLPYLFICYYRHMVSNISYIDDTRVAVWGWSYGGYLAAQLLAEDDRRLISCAVSVAPVVKWQLYGKFISSFF